MSGVIIGDKERGSMGRLLENTLALFLAVVSIFLIVASAWLVQALLIYRACGFVFWVAGVAPRCLSDPHVDVLPRWW